MTASAPKKATKQNNLEISRAINFDVKMADFFDKITLTTGEVIERGSGKKSKKPKPELRFHIIESDNNDVSSMRYLPPYDDEYGSVDIYFALIPAIFEKIYNEVANGIIPTHVMISLIKPVSDNNSLISFGTGESEYIWDTVNNRVVQLDNFGFQYNRQKPESRRKVSKNIISYVKDNKIQIAMGIILLFLIATMWR